MLLLQLEKLWLQEWRVVSAQKHSFLLYLVDVPEAFVGLHVGVLHLFGLVVRQPARTLGEVCFVDVALVD